MKWKFSEHWISIGVDAFFALCGSACIGMFIYNSMHSDELLNAGRTRIARVFKGQFQRKQLGTLLFTEAEPGTPLYERDALWLGEGEAGEIRFEQGGKLKVEEKTFLVLRTELAGAAQPAQVFRGKATYAPGDGGDSIVGGFVDRAPEPGKEQVSPPGSPSVDVIPPSPAPAPSVEQGDFYPAPKTLFYVVGDRQSVELTFAWPEPLTGKLEVRDGKDSVVAAVEVKGEKFARATLKVNQTYTWQAINASGRPAGQRFSFEILKYTPEALSRSALDPDRPIEVLQ